MSHTLAETVNCPNCGRTDAHWYICCDGCNGEFEGQPNKINTMLLAALKWAVKTIDRLSTTYEIKHTSDDPSKTDWDKLFEAKQVIAHLRN